MLARRRIPAAAWAALPARILVAWAATHSSAAASPLSKKDQAAFHAYSRTCTKSIRIGTVTARRAASAVVAANLGVFSFPQANPGRLRAGVRRPAPAYPVAGTAGGSLLMLAAGAHEPATTG